MNEALSMTSNDWTIRTNFTNPSQQFFSDQSKFPTRQATTVGAILAFVFIFFGLVGNLILITTILSVRKLRSNIINIFIVSVKYRSPHSSVYFCKSEIGRENNKD